MAPAGAADAEPGDTGSVAFQPLSTEMRGLDEAPLALPPQPEPGFQTGRDQMLALAAGACLLVLVLGVGLTHRPAGRATASAAGSGLTVLPAPPHPEIAQATPMLAPVADPGPANGLPAGAEKAASAVVRSQPAVVQLGLPMTAAAPAPMADAADLRGAAASTGAAAADENGCSGTAAERMLCADPELADFDREMRRDLREAARAGVPPEDLRLGQEDFARRRDAAARRSPDAVAEVYDQRIVELERMISDAPR